MIRKVVIVMLAIVAFPAFIVAVVSYWTPFEVCTGDSERAARLVMRFRDGWAICWSLAPVYDESMSQPDLPEYGPRLTPQPITQGDWAVPGICVGPAILSQANVSRRGAQSTVQGLRTSTSEESV